jgi:transposase
MKIVVMCGADVHDNSITARIAVNKEEPGTRVFRYTVSGRRAMLKYLTAAARRQGAKRIVVAYEASSLGFVLHDECKDAGIECYVLAPTKMPRSEETTKRKTDWRDAQMILEQLRAHVLAGNELAKVWIPDDLTRDDREVVRMRLAAGEKLTASKTQVRTLLKRTGMEKPRDVGQAWTVSDRHWLQRLTEPESELPEGARVGLASLLREIAFLEAEIERLDSAVKALADKERYKAANNALVEQLKGVGCFTAMTFLTELGDLRRFKNRKKIGAFMGLVPSSNETGEHNDRKGHITRQGPARLRKMLCQAAWARIGSDANEAKVHKRIVEKNPKKKKIATVACMRRLGVRMWHIGMRAQIEAGVYETDKLPCPKRIAV